MGGPVGEPGSLPRLWHYVGILARFVQASFPDDSPVHAQLGGIRAAIDVNMEAAIENVKRDPPDPPTLAWPPERCERSFELLGEGAVRVRYACGVTVEFSNLPPWPATHAVFEERLPGKVHPHVPERI